jgi:hypothetical protein
MDVVGTVTAGAAGLAALLSAVNLYISGQRETQKWKRDSLVELLVISFDTSWRIRSLCMSLAADSDHGKRIELLKEISVNHKIETDTLTRLRLLAPSRVVRAAEALHEAGHKLVDASLDQPIESEKTDSAHEKLHRVRAEFITAARAAIHLRDPAPVGHRHAGTRWNDLLTEVNEATVEPPMPPSATSQAERQP